MTFTTRPVALAVLMAAPLAAHAESSFQSTTGTGALSSQARVDFQINIPKMLFLQVGTGTLWQSSATVDLVTFDVPAANVGDGVAVAATAGSGNLGNGAVTARVRGNGGNVGLTAVTGGALSNGSASISYTQITTSSNNVNFAAPVLADGTSAPVMLAATGLGIVNQDATWTYVYENDNVVQGGTYGGSVANNGRVTYTASLP